MIFKITILSVLLASTLFSSSFNFIEDRYSDALERSITLDGEISFEKNRLFIKYKDSNREILYSDSSIELKEGVDILVLVKEESQRMAQYFKIILMLYENDETELQDKFEIEKMGEKTLLTPKDYMKDFLQKISLQRYNSKLKEIKLFLKNGDRITISIKDEIR